ncbi:hypothetical protein SK128_028207, partial [Halocaridina rubra]
MSSGNNGGKMLDTGLLYEAMKARPIPCPPPVPHASGSSAAPSSLVNPGDSPTTTSFMMMSSSPTNGTCMENNLNKGGNNENKGYTDKHVLNIDQRNYMLKCGPSPMPVCVNARKENSRSSSNASTTPTSDQILFNVTTASECRNSNILTCICCSSPYGGGGNNSISSTASNTRSCINSNCSVSGSCGNCIVSSYASNNSAAFGSRNIHHSNGTTTTSNLSSNYNNSNSDSNYHNVSHAVTSLLPLLECRACFHNVCTSFSTAHPCSRPQHTLPPPTLTSDV